MMELNELSRRFEQWLDEVMPNLTASASVNVHIDELCGSSLAAQEQIDACAALFEWSIASLAGRMAGKIVILMIPLRAVERLDRSPPEWGALAQQLAPTPPSIYVMHVAAFLQADPAQRYITATNVPFPVGPTTAAYYQCWRNGDDPEADGWARDVRIVSTAFVS